MTEIQSATVGFNFVINEEGFVMNGMAPHLDSLGFMHGLATYGTAEHGRETFHLIHYEFPFVEGLARSKEQQELEDIETCARMVLHAGPEDLKTLGSGPDPNRPPDAVMMLRGAKIGIETAQLLLPSTDGRGGSNPLARWRQFERFRDDFMRIAPTRSRELRKYRGKSIIVSFGTQHVRAGSGQPHRRPADLVHFLGSIDPPTAAQVEASKAAGRNDAVYESPDQTLAVTFGILPPGYRSGFVTANGFELGFAFNALVTSRTCREELRRVIVSHDQPINDLLIVTVNQATRSGLYLASSELVANMLFATADPLDGWQPQHLRNIVLHDVRANRHRWLTGRL